MSDNNYPFMTKKQVGIRIEEDPEFVRECVLVMQGRQTEDEREVRETRHRNRMGWMSSHAVNGGKTADKIASGEVLTDEEQDRAQGMVCRYSKQLASHFRLLAIEASPELAEAATLYSAG